MVFSIFSKKPDTKKSEEPSSRHSVSSGNTERERSPRSAQPSKSTPSTRPASNSRLNAEQLKEAARRTAEKIDRIESEMITPGSPNANMPKAITPSAVIPVTNAKPIRPSQAEADGMHSQLHDSLTRSTSIVLGDSMHANAIDVVGSTLPGILEEAAILFSNAQYEAAKLTLLAAVEEPLPTGYASLAWLMLFDYYQIINDRMAFEGLAMDYAAKFEASPPGWKSDIVEPAVAQNNTSTANFVVPAHLDANLKSSIQTLLKAAANKREVRIDFGNVKKVDFEAAAQLVSFFKFFVAAERPLIVLHAQKLYEAAVQEIEAGRADEDNSLWQLTLMSLRLLGQHQAFDDCSIDFCVTYEVSPPAWEPMPIWVRGDVEDTVTQVGTGSQDAAGNSFVLKGEIVGAISQERQALKEFMQTRRDLTIDCRKLKRLDFGAAGELLNEVMNMRNANKGVLFAEPNYLVYTLMMVMGLHEVAEIRTRKS